MSQPFGAPRTLGQVLTEQAARRPDHPYLYFEDKQITYREMDDAVSAVAGGLAAAGVARGDRVALLLPNVPEFLYAWLGAARHGAVTVPMNPAYKREEIRYILENSGATAIVTTGDRCADIDAIGPGLPALGHRFVLDDNPGESWTSFRSLLDAPPSSSSGPTNVQPEDPAAIIYTSGTTGHPKGVVLTHHNYDFDTWSLTTHLGVTEADRFLCFLPLFHVNAQVVSALSAVHSRGSLILLREFKPGTFFEDLARYRATTFSAVPTVYAILNTLPNADRYDLTSLRYCICGAAPMPVEVFTTFEKKFGATIVEGYGLSEATCGSCVNPAGADDVRKIGSIGIPLPGQEMDVFDPEGRPVPDGEVGEIVVRGECLMREYFQNPTATEEALVDGWLHTGDLGYRDEDGYYFVVGRKKEMIIRGGINIYPKEIEEVIYRHDAVQEAAVIGVPDEIWGETVCACVVPKEGAAIVEAEILSLCGEHLADFKVPQRVVVMTAFPKTPTGKIQKSRITLPEG